MESEKTIQDKIRLELSKHRNSSQNAKPETSKLIMEQGFK